MENFRQNLANKLFKRGFLWSYSKESELNNCEDFDNILIEKSLCHLEFEELPEIFDFFGYKKVESVWRNRMLPQGSYLYIINWLLAVLFFNEKEPDKLLMKYGKLD